MRPTSAFSSRNIDFQNYKINKFCNKTYNFLVQLAKVMRRNQVRNNFDVKDFLDHGYSPEVVSKALSLSTELPEHDLSNIQICEFCFLIFVLHIKVIGFITYDTFFQKVYKIQRLISTMFL